jgi:N-carbamoyl-L-amino-acid hydrolase
LDQQWIIDTIEHISGIGRDKKGITRLAFDDNDWQAREYVKQLMTEAGLAVRVDVAGNIIGRLEGSVPDAPAVVTGSHLDTVPEAGKFDGVLGVVAGIAAASRLKARGLLSHPLEVVAFVAEESSRFGYATIGSKAMMGQVNLSAWSKAADQRGKTLQQAMAERDIDLQAIKAAARGKDTIKAFLELHIEQGPVLEKTATKIGIVETIAAPTRLRITIEGMPGHSGATPMDERRDALVSAAMVILAVQEIAMDEHHRGTVGTVGVVKVQPNVMNVIPGIVELGVDIRGVEQESIVDAIQQIKDAISTIADDQETPVSIEVLTSERPVKMNSEIIEYIEQACDELGLSNRRMNSGAGHDAMAMAGFVPAGLIFVPCRLGISHNPEEYVAPEEIMSGVAVLTETLYNLAK